jgi:N-acylneuraminate cytidylyltransferase
MKWTAIIPARAGSKGIQNKNLCKVGGVPLYARAINQAIEAGASKVIISSNISEILEARFDFDVTVARRPEFLAEDTSKMSEVIRHVCEKNLVVGTVVLLQPTSPLRKASDIKKALDVYSNSKFDLVFTITDADNGCLKYGFVEYGIFKPIASQEYCFSNRQELPKLYKPNGAVYVFDASWFLVNGSFETSSIGASYMTPTSSIDIDSMHDIILCEDVLKSVGDA